jgi:acyl-CoA synthetase (AMP-forming)/AMP-acid ligase II
MSVPGAADAKFAREAWLRALERTAGIEADLYLTLPVLIERLALEYGTAPALMSNDGSLCYGELVGRCNQYAHWGLAQGLRAGDVAALLMLNSAEYVAVWLGLTRIGVTVALLNTHLAADALVHSIHIVAPRLIVVGAELAAGLSAVRTRIRPDFGVTAPLPMTSRISRPPSSNSRRRRRARPTRRPRSMRRRSTSTPPVPPGCRRRPSSPITA